MLGREAKESSQRLSILEVGNINLSEKLVGGLITNPDDAHEQLELAQQHGMGTNMLPDGFTQGFNLRVEAGEHLSKRSLHRRMSIGFDAVVLLNLHLYQAL